MIYYHASCVKGIRKLIPAISEHGVPLVYFSEKRENVLVYLSNAIEKYCKEHCFTHRDPWAKWGPYGFSDGLQVIYEYYPDALVKTYKGVSGYIYSVKDIADSEYTISIPYTAVSCKPVEVTDEEYIPDAYEAILQAEGDGLIKILRYDEISEKTKDWLCRTITEEYSNATEHPEYRFFLKENFPGILG